MTATAAPATRTRYVEPSSRPPRTHKAPPPRCLWSAACTQEATLTATHYGTPFPICEACARVMGSRPGFALVAVPTHAIGSAGAWRVTGGVS